ncbi:MAG: hypothetical protein K940chlam2_00521 [Chlamydiae bacterium]|nr:hypothetical protein [Chlamydiota bacterium]
MNTYINEISPRFYSQASESERFRSESFDSFLKGGAAFRSWIEEQPSVTISEEALVVSDVCHDYALGKILGFNPLEEMAEITSNSERMERVLERYFTQVSSPFDGDLIVYFQDDFRDPKINQPITHSGIAMADDLVKSKWGNTPYLLIHPTFHSLEAWGDKVHYYTPKKELS